MKDQANDLHKEFNNFEQKVQIQILEFKNQTFQKFGEMNKEIHDIRMDNNINFSKSENSILQLENKMINSVSQLKIDFTWLLFKTVSSIIIGVPTIQYLFKLLGIK